MFQLTLDSVVPLVNMTVYAALAAFAITMGKSRLKKQLLLVIVISGGWSIASLLASAGPLGEAVALKMLVPVFSAWAVVTYAIFTAAFVRRGQRAVARAGYAWLGVVIVSVVFGLLTQAIPALNNIVVYRLYGWFLDGVALGKWALFLIAFLLLVRSYKTAVDPEEKNRTSYLFAGLTFMLAVGITSTVMPGRTATPFTISFAINVLLMTYALARYRLLSFQLLLRKWGVYTGVSVCITLAYLGLLVGLSRLLPLLPAGLGIPTTVIAVVLFASLFNWLKSALDRAADRLFYGKGYAHRKVSLAFAGRVSSLVDLDEIAGALLGPLVKAIRAGKIILLLPSKDDYAAKFIAGANEEERRGLVKLRRNSPLTQWLEREGQPLVTRILATSVEFKSMAQEDKDAAAEIEILCPILNRRRLIGILALGKRPSGGGYSRSDIDLAMMLVGKAATAIENAQAHREARDRVDTDELTGLRNHRCFQQRLESEIEKCSQLGQTFSLLCIDLDSFNAFNDASGHVLGDEVLTDTGRLIKDALRSKDFAARYGGDEFAIILPETSLESAAVAAETLVKRFENLMNQKGRTLTCSIGIAGWRTDGGMRGQIIDAALKALNEAKRGGGNRACLSRDQSTAQAESPPGWTELAEESNTEIAGTVYALAAVVDARDHFTYKHSQNVAGYATEIARAIGYPKQGIWRIRAAALLHDIGKLDLPDQLFTKPGKLSNEDWHMIRRHPALGVNILKYIVGLRGCLDAVMFHHERYDGKGYPKGISGKAIPLDARIMAVADAYDAITAQRCYRNGVKNQLQAIAEIERCAGAQFDPAIVQAFVGLLRKSSGAAQPHPMPQPATASPTG